MTSRAACALFLLAAGCGSSNPLYDAAACAPDTPAPPTADSSTDAGQAADVAAPMDVAPTADVAATADVGASPDAAADLSAAADAPKDVAASQDAYYGYPDVLRLDFDALTDGPAPPGVVFGFPPKLPSTMVTVDAGLREELSASMGIYVADVAFADAIYVVAGYGVDHVYMKVGSVMPPWFVPPKPGLPFIVSFGGARVYTEEPTLPPHPAYAPARALYDAMTKVPQTFEDGNPTRVSPGGRVKCQLPKEFDGARCYFTGVQNVYIF